MTDRKECLLAIVASRVQAQGMPNNVRDFVDECRPLAREILDRDEAPVLISYEKPIVIYHNIFIGKRAAGYMYNQVGTNIAIREFISTIGNLAENFGYKTDDFTGDGPADGARTGNWPLMWGVGHHHNVHVNCNTTGAEAPASFVPYFYGTVSYHPLTAFTNTVAWPDMKDPRSVGYASVEGIGNYHWNTTSPIANQFTPALVDIPIRFDLDGLQRSQYDPPGPYAADLRPTSRNTARSLRVITLRAK